MGSFLMSCLAVIVIAVGAAVALDFVQQPADAAFHSPTGVRLHTERS